MHIITENTNTGVIITPPRPEDLQVGALSPTLTNTASDWRAHECDGEWQKDMAIDWESEACMSFTGSNNIATYLNWLIDTKQILAPQLAFLQANGYISMDGKVALSPRFTAKMSGTTTNGSDFQNVWNSLKNDGCVPDTAWPMPSAQMNANPTDAWAIYYASPTQSVIALGKEFLKYFSIQWEWLVSSGNGASQTDFVEWLQVAPIHLAIQVCSPWNTDAPIPGCGTGAQHGVQLSYVEPNVVNDILDHYSPFDKQLEANYTLSYAVRGFPTQIPQVVPEVPATASSTLPVTSPTTYQEFLTDIRAILQELKNDLGITSGSAPSSMLGLVGMTTIESFITNPVVLSFIGLFLTGGLTAVEPSTPFWVQGIIGVIIVFIGVHFHLKAVAAAGTRPV